MSILQPKIYVICVTAYQCGIAHGQWINANQKPSSLKRAVRRLIASSPVCSELGEWAIHAKKDFGDVRIGEYNHLETIFKIARFIAKEGELGAALVKELSDVDEAKRVLQEDYLGVYESQEDFASQCSNVLSAFDDLMHCHVDHECHTRDTFTADFFALEVEGKMHIFADRSNR